MQPWKVLLHCFSWYRETKSAGWHLAFWVPKQKTYFPNKTIVQSSNSLNRTECAGIVPMVSDQVHGNLRLWASKRRWYFWHVWLGAIALTQGREGGYGNLQEKNIRKMIPVWSVSIVCFGKRFCLLYKLFNKSNFYLCWSILFKLCFCSLSSTFIFIISFLIISLGDLTYIFSLNPAFLPATGPHRLASAPYS